MKIEYSYGRSAVSAYGQKQVGKAREVLAISLQPTTSLGSIAIAKATVPSCSFYFDIYSFFYKKTIIFARASIFVNFSQN